MRVVMVAAAGLDGCASIVCGTTKVGDAGVVAGAGNIIASGYVGVGVDGINGANSDHNPNPVDV